MWVAMGFIIVGAILQTTSYGVPQVLIARFITGIGTGIETSTVPMYQSELCDADKRGRLVSSEPLFVGVGIVIAYFFDYGMSFTPGSAAWRVPIACQVIPAFVVIALVFGLPESPRWLYARNRNDEALQVMCDVWDSGPDGEKVQKMQKDILGALELERQHGEYQWRDILKRDEVQTGRRVLLAYGMQFMNQMGGINLVVYYVPSALENNVGLTRNLSLLIGGAVQCMFFVGSLVPTFFLDQMGRRRPMMWGSLGLALSMMMISILLSFQRPQWAGTATATKTAEASVAFFFTYMLIFGATANCIPWVYVPDFAATCSCEGYSSRDLQQLAVELFRGHDHTNTAGQLSLARLPHLHGSQLLLHPADLLFLSRNHQSHSGRHRLFIHGRWCRWIAQVGQKASTGARECEAQ